MASRARPRHGYEPIRAAALKARVDPRVMAAVFLGGAIGGLLRTILADGYPQAATSWPWVTFAVNIAGAFVLGYVATTPERTPRAAYRRPLLGTGFCGGLTTFATMQIELLKMLDAHSFALAAEYAVTSIACGLLAVIAATTLARRTQMAR